MLISHIYSAAGTSNYEKEQQKKKRRKLKALLRAGKISKETYDKRLSQKKKRLDLLKLPITVRGYGNSGR